MSVKINIFEEIHCGALNKNCKWIALPIYAYYELSGFLWALAISHCKYIMSTQNDTIWHMCPK